MKHIISFIALIQLSFAIEVDTFDASLLRNVDLMDLARADKARAIAVDVLRMHYRVHILDVLNRTENSLIPIEFKNPITESAFSVIFNEIACCFLNIHVKSRVKYNQFDNKILEVPGTDCKNYTNANWSYVFLVNVIDRFMGHKQKYFFTEKDAMVELDNIFLKIEEQLKRKYTGYDTNISNAKNNIKTYFEQLELYKFLRCLLSQRNRYLSMYNNSIDKIEKENVQNKLSDSIYLGMTNLLSQNGSLSDALCYYNSSYKSDAYIVRIQDKYDTCLTKNTASANYMLNSVGIKLSKCLLEDNFNVTDIGKAQLSGDVTLPVPITEMCDMTNVYDRGVSFSDDQIKSIHYILEDKRYAEKISEKITKLTGKQYNWQEIGTIVREGYSTYLGILIHKMNLQYLISNEKIKMELEKLDNIAMKMKLDDETKNAIHEYVKILLDGIGYFDMLSFLLPYDKMNKEIDEHLYRIMDTLMLTDCFGIKNWYRMSKYKDIMQLIQRKTHKIGYYSWYNKVCSPDGDSSKYYTEKYRYIFKEINISEYFGILCRGNYLVNRGRILNGIETMIKVLNENGCVTGNDVFECQDRKKLIAFFRYVGCYYLDNVDQILRDDQ